MRGEKRRGRENADECKATRVADHRLRGEDEGREEGNVNERKKRGEKERGG